jgi:hypothetical protein
MKNRQTAIDWLIEQLEPAISLQSKIIHKYKEQAKQMEKQQIIDADLAGVKRTMLNVHNNLVKIQHVLDKLNDMEAGKLNHENGEQYYNETYGK